MSIVNISVDTETKSVSVTIDGTAIPNVSSFSGYCCCNKDGECEGVDVSVSTSEMVNKVQKSTYYYTRGSEQAKKIQAEGQVLASCKFKDFVSTEADIGLSRTMAALLQ